MAGYVRQAAASIVPDAEVTATPLNSEFNALQGAFNGSTGHGHTGAAGDGPKLSLTAAVSGVLPVANGGLGQSTLAAFRTDLYSAVIHSANGSDTDPTFSFSGDTNTGIYWVGADQLGITTGGTNRMTISTAAITPSLPIRGQDGTVGAPAYSFNGDTNTGIYLAGADQLAISAGGVQQAVFTATTNTIVGDTTFNGTVSATSFSGIGTALTALNASNLGSGTVPSARISGSYTGFTTITASGAVTAASFSGSGASLTALNASNLGSGTVPNARISGAYTGFTNVTGTGSVDFAKFLGNAGDSAAAPSYTWTGDTDTGIWYAGSDKIGFTAGGVNRMTMDTFALELGRIRLTSTTDASLISTNHAFQVGPDNSSNLIIDNNEIVARNNGVASFLGLNLDDGLVVAGPGGFECRGSLLVTTGGLTVESGVTLLKGVLDVSVPKEIQFGNNDPLTFDDVTNTFTFAADADIAKATVQAGDFADAAGNKFMPTRSITAGNGLSGGGTLAANRTITLGTPSSITNSTTNSVTTTSHTHALGFLAAEVYTGTSNSVTDYPVGTVLLVDNEWDVTARNGTATLRIDSATTACFEQSGAGTALAGTWRKRGAMKGGADSCSIFQRTA